MQQEIQTVSGDRKITKYILNDGEMGSIADSIYKKLLLEKVSEKEAVIKRDELIENQCVPMLPSDAINGFKSGTPIIGFVSGEYGDLFYRAWWAENGGAVGTAKVEQELGSATTLCGDFKKWFENLPFGSTLIGVFAVNKQAGYFDISAVRAWIAHAHSSNIDTKKDIKISRMKEWVWSAELTALWFHFEKIKSNNSGFFFPSI